MVTLPVTTKRSGDPVSGPHTVSSGLSPLVTTTFLTTDKKTLRIVFVCKTEIQWNKGHFGANSFVPCMNITHLVSNH